LNKSQNYAIIFHDYKIIPSFIHILTKLKLIVFNLLQKQ
jgi:hypothetical protein